uniref:Uncharacterized protein n=1 Tax=viral metagenome TaxID=1070528 RepID=A0A6C0DHL0_9ZZZZ
MESSPIYGLLMILFIASGIIGLMAIAYVIYRAVKFWKERQVRLRASSDPELEPIASTV